jgi:hypothetical protein
MNMVWIVVVGVGVSGVIAAFVQSHGRGRHTDLPA